MTSRLATGAALLATLIASASAAPPSGDPYEPWARTLSRHVSERGEVDFRAVAAERNDLDSFLGYVARVSPRSTAGAFPGRQARLAYYLNAYNALAMFNVIDSGLPRHLGAAQRFIFFRTRRFVVGGESMSLHMLENEVIRPLGDERVHFALNCMSVGCPRLPREPFRPERLDQTLDRSAQEFFAEARNLQVLPASRRVRVSSILKFYREDFLARSPTLIAYINRYARPAVPEDYEVEFIDYDWTVNFAP
jgi:hypothetical protein